MPQHNFLSLVRDPSQPSFDPVCTNPPVAAFESGFLDFDREQIRGFIAERLPTTIQGTDPEPGQYALLDGRSDSDKTIVLGVALSSLHDRDPDVMTENELEQWQEECEENIDMPPDVWREYRVTFDEAEQLCTVLTIESDFTQKLYNDDFVASHTNAQGVFLVKEAWRAFKATREASENDDME